MVAAISPYFTPSPSVALPVAALASRCKLPPAPCVVFLCDNSATGGVFDRGTSSDPIFGFILHVVAQVVHQWRFQPNGAAHRRSSQSHRRLRQPTPFPRLTTRSPEVVVDYVADAVTQSLRDSALDMLLAPAAHSKSATRVRTAENWFSKFCALRALPQQLPCPLPASYAGIFTDFGLYLSTVPSQRGGQPLATATIRSYVTRIRQIVSLETGVYITSATTSSPLSCADTARTPLLDIIASQLPRVSSCMC